MSAFPGSRCVAPDLREFGGGLTRDGESAIADYTDDMAAILDSMGIDTAVCLLELPGEFNDVLANFRRCL